MIYTNESFNDLQKLHYLEASLKGNASLTIAALSTRTTNYSIAWVMVKQRHENNKILIKSHVDSILDSHTIQKECAQTLREFKDNLLKNGAHS